MHKYQIGQKVKLLPVSNINPGMERVVGEVTYITELIFRKRRKPMYRLALASPINPTKTIMASECALQPIDNGCASFLSRLTKQPLPTKELV